MNSSSSEMLRIWIWGNKKSYIVRVGILDSFFFLMWILYICRWNFWENLELFEAKPSFSNSKNKSNTDNKMKHGRLWELLLLLVIKVKEWFRKKETTGLLPSSEAELLRRTGRSSQWQAQWPWKNYHIINTITYVSSPHPRCRQSHLRSWFPYSPHETIRYNWDVAKFLGIPRRKSRCEWTLQGSCSPWGTRRDRNKLKLK